MCVLVSYRKTLHKAVKETSRSKERTLVKLELLQLFNSFLLAGAGEHEYVLVGWARFRNSLLTSCAHVFINAGRSNDKVPGLSREVGPCSRKK